MGSGLPPGPMDFALFLTGRCSKMNRLLFLLLIIPLARSASADPRYTHQLLLSGFADTAGGGYLNEKGDWAMGGRLPGGYDDFYVNGVRFTFNDPNILGGILHGFNDNKDVIYVAGGPNLRGGLNTVYKNQFQISSLFHPEFGNDDAIRINNAGQVAWHKNSFYVLRDGTLIDGPATFYFGGETMDMDSAGQVLWFGSDTSGQGASLFLDSTKLYGSVGFGTIRNGRIADNGTWCADNYGTNGIPKAYKNGVDLTVGVDRLINFGQVQDMNAMGHVIWLGSDTTGYNYMYVDQTNVSVGVLGEKTTVADGHINDPGIVAFMGAMGPIFNKYNIYADGYSLTQELFGQSFGVTGGRLDIYDMNNRGQILWGYANRSDLSDWSIYLSTPVSEPSVCAIPGFLILAIRRLPRCVRVLAG